MKKVVANLQKILPILSVLPGTRIKIVIGRGMRWHAAFHNPCRKAFYIPSGWSDKFHGPNVKPGTKIVKHLMWNLLNCLKEDIFDLHKKFSSNNWFSQIERPLAKKSFFFEILRITWLSIGPNWMSELTNKAIDKMSKADKFDLRLKRLIKCRIMTK